ncbi:MAG: hypothetical protein ABSC22_10605 [Roseiarcus sp.]
MNKIVALSALALSLSVCTGCMSNREANGALIGGAGGAVIGGVASHSVGGALVGGAVGAAAGILVADLTRPHYARWHCYYSSAAGRRVCHYW